MKEIKAVVGTNSWGSKVYGNLLRGSYVDETVINTAVKRAMELGVYGVQNHYSIISRKWEEEGLSYLHGIHSFWSGYCLRI